MGRRLALSTNRSIYWLNLSGGGNRAAIYHFGVMHRLHEAGLLGDVVGISATSGGSIVTGAWTQSLGSLRGGNRPTDPWPLFSRTCIKAFRRGLLCPAVLVALAWTSYTASAGVLYWQREYALCVAIVGFLCHVSAFLIHIQDGALSAEGWRSYYNASAGAGRGMRWKWLGKALLRPPASRILSLNLRMYSGMLLSSSSSCGTSTFYNAVELEKGRQVVLSSAGLHAVASPRDMDILVRRRTYNGALFRGEPLLAEAVAASSSFPPVFKPVRAVIQEEDGRTRPVHLLDGGVTDNAGFKLFMSLYLSARAQPLERGGSDPSLPVTGIRTVITCDAGRSIKPLRRVSSRLKGVARLLSVVQNTQSDDMFGRVDALEALGLNPLLFGLQVGIPSVEEDGTFRHDKDMSEISSLLPRIRTHLDAFTIPEIVALAYCGYRQTSNVVGSAELPLPGQHKPSQFSSMQDYANGYGWVVSETDVLRTLRESGARVSLKRTGQVIRERLRYKL